MAKKSAGAMHVIVRRAHGGDGGDEDVGGDVGRREERGMWRQEIRWAAGKQRSNDSGLECKTE